MSYNQTLPIEIRDIGFVWEWYENQKKAIFDYQAAVLNLFSSGSMGFTSIFSGFTRQQIIDYFEEQKYELERIVCFYIIASSEGQIMNDFKIRIKNNKKDNLTKAYKKYKTRKGIKPILVNDDFLKLFKPIFPNRPEKEKIEHFNSALHFRHWFAHGRHWEQNIGQNYTPFDVYDVSSNLLNVIGIYAQ